VFYRGFEFFQVHRLDQMFGKSRLHAFLDVAVHSKTTDGNAADAASCAQVGHELQAAAIRQADVTDEKIELTAI
jgi:hypothetical protein